MEGRLYKLSFVSSDKVYIGKTYKSLSDRLRDHIKNVAKFPNRKLSKAIIKHGRPNITLIGNFPEEILEFKEIEYIRLYNSYYNGYNSTLGGDGKRYLEISDEDIISSYTGNHAETARKFGIDPKTAKLILNNAGIVTRGNKDFRPERRKPLIVIELNEIFSSAEELAKCFIEADLSNYSVDSVAKGIRKAASGSRSSYLGFTIKYYEPIA